MAILFCCMQALLVDFSFFFHIANFTNVPTYCNLAWPNTVDTLITGILNKRQIHILKLSHGGNEKSVEENQVSILQSLL